MSKKNVFVAAALAICVLATAGTLLASNMGFKLNYALTGPLAAGGAGTGKQLLALPYFRQTGVDNQLQLILDIGGGTVAAVNNVTRYNKASDTITSYTGRMGAPATAPALAAGEGYLVQMNSNVNYIIVGAHDPSLQIQLTGPLAAGGLGTGKQFVALPYNGTAANMFTLIQDIGGGVVTPVNNVTRYNKASDTLTSYTGRMGAPAAAPALVPGEAYLIQMNSNVPYIASHY
jgi:hypothetical protein